MPSEINMAVIEELLSLTDDGDKSLLTDLIQMFLEDSPSKLAMIRAGLTSGDVEQIEKAAHSMKGSAGNLGATNVQEICDRLQHVSRGSMPETEISMLVQQLEAPYANAVRELRELLAQHS